MKLRIAAVAIVVVSLVHGGRAAALVGSFYSTDITADTLLACPAVLDGPVVVRNDATLTIPAGCVVRGQPRSGPVIPGLLVDAPGALIVTEGARLVVSGSANAPVIFTTCAVDTDADGVPDDLDGNGFPDRCTPATPEPALFDDDPVGEPLAPLDANGRGNVGLWGGIAILGNAPTNLAAKCVPTQYGTCSIPALVIPGFPASLTSYGGPNPHDDSGTLRYVSIRHGGASIDELEPYSALLLAGVGDGTVIENVEVYAAFEDGFDWRGGTVHARRLASWFVGGDSFDVDQGYTGLVQFALAVSPWFNELGSTCVGSPTRPYGASSGSDAGEFEGDDYAFADPVLNVNTRRESDTQDVGGTDANFEYDRTPWPLSFSSFYNVTVVGANVGSAQRGSGGATVTGAEFPGPNPLCNSKRGFNLRNGYAGTIFNTIVVNTSNQEGLEVNPDNNHDGNATFGCPPGSPEAGLPLPGREGAPCFGADENVLNTSTPWASSSAGLVKLVCSTFDDTGTLDAIELEVVSDGNLLSESLRGVSPASSFDDNVINGGFTNLRNEDQTFNPQGNANGKLVPGLKTHLLDPRPQGLFGTGGCVQPKGPGRDALATYRGAFPAGVAQQLWTTPWSVMAQGRVIVD